MATGFAFVDWVSRHPVDATAPKTADMDRTSGSEVAAELSESVHGGDNSQPLAGPEKEPENSQDAESPGDLFLFFLGRNFAVYIWLLAGLLSAGTLTFLVLFANGIALGQTIGLASLAGVPAGILADLLLPHGVLEMGAFCIAGAVGFQGFRLAVRFSQLNRESIKRLRLGLVVAYGLGTLALAAGVEAVVPANLAEMHGRR